MNTPNDLISIDEACRLLEVSRPTFARIRVDQSLHEYKIGKRSRYSKSEIVEKILKKKSLQVSELQPATEEIKVTNTLVIHDYSLEDIFGEKNVIDIDLIGMMDAFSSTSLMFFILDKIKAGKKVRIESEKFIKAAYLNSVGFFSELLPRASEKVAINPRFYDSSRAFYPGIILPISHVGFKGAERRYTEELKKILKTQGFSDDIGHYIGWTLGELADNAHTHSNSNGCCFISIERLTGKESSFLNINILDMGEGIHATLKKNPKYKDLSDEKALIMAFKSKVSSWGDEYERGKGLTDILKIAFECNSFFRVESGENAFRFYCKGDFRKIEKIKPSSKINGTRFSITLIDEEFNEVSRQVVDTFIDEYLEKI